MGAQEFLDRMLERFIRHWDVEGMQQVAAGEDPDSLKVKVGCSQVSIFRGREMTMGLLSAMSEPGGPFSAFKPIPN